MDEDFDFDNFSLLPGVDLALWLVIAVGAVVCFLIAAIAVWLV